MLQCVTLFCINEVLNVTLSADLGDFKRRLPRTPSTGTMSSADDLDEREPPSLSDNGVYLVCLCLYHIIFS